MLKETYIELLNQYTDNTTVKNKLWLEIESHYTSQGRYYHTLKHLENLLKELTEIKGEINDWNAMLFALYYHDIIYDVQQSDNEVKSAELAQERMIQLSVPKETLERCTRHILASQIHITSTDSDTNYFTDADLAILGQPWNTYDTYTKNIRKEYSMYSEADYNKGRKKVLNHFLDMYRIYKTDYFYIKYEQLAKENATRELATL